MNKEERIPIVIQRYFRGESTQEELKDALFLLENPRPEYNIEPILEELWDKGIYHISHKEDSQNLPLILRKIHLRIKPELKEIQHIKSRKLVINISKIAAVLLIGLVLGLFINTLNKPEPLYYTSIVPKGSISQMVLPDSTLVYLNSDSELKYKLNGSKNQREVFLDGEAWFHVTENSKRPFVVHTTSYDIRVMGTEFNVKAYKDEPEIVTTLESGKVQIPSTHRFKMKSAIILVPGQQLIYNRDNHSVTTKEVTTRFYTSWKDNKLIFINMNLKELIVLLERKYGVDIEVSDPSILNCHYDGTIKNESILEVMELIKHTMPIQYTVVGQKIHIIKK